MPVTTQLPNCINVKVYPRSDKDPPLTGAVTVTAGGASGDGSVVVTTVPPQAIEPVLTGTTSDPFDSTGVTEVYMHYITTPTKPQTVEVTLAPLAPPPPPGR